MDNARAVFRGYEIPRNDAERFAHAFHGFSPIEQLLVPRAAQFGPANAGDYFSRKLKKATGISAHGIRHSFITRMRQAGIEYSIAMAIVGHKPVGMTAGYGEVLIEDMAKQIAKIC